MTRTVSPAAPPPPADPGSAPPAADAKANSSKQIAATPPAPLTSARKADTPPAVRTVELYFTDELGRRLPSTEAVINYEGRWQIRGHARPAIAVVRDSGGRIGLWADYHLERSPSDLGFDQDIVVLCWDDQQQGVAVAAITLLQTALGREWKTKLRELCYGK